MQYLFDNLLSKARVQANLALKLCKRIVFMINAQFIVFAQVYYSTLIVFPRKNYLIGLRNNYNNNQNLMEQQMFFDQRPIYYLTNVCLFTPKEINLLCLYKKFIELVIMSLGEDWRIESSLFTEQILSFKRSAQPQLDLKDFNLFNQFLSSFLVGKANKEFDFLRLSQTEIQQKFIEKVTVYLSQEQIKQSLTFKTLSLGFCITASEVWLKTFKDTHQKPLKLVNKLEPFLKLDCLAGEKYINQIRKEWNYFDLKELGDLNLQKLEKSLASKSDLSKAQVFSDMVTYVKQFQFQQKRIRVFQLANQFYLRTLIVWLIFSIKMFFALSYKDYLKFCKEFMQEGWQESFQEPLQKFQQTVEREWNKLLKDYTVALHDDLYVLKKLVQKVRQQLEREWKNRLQLINPVEKK